MIKDKLILWESDETLKKWHFSCYQLQKEIDSCGLAFKWKDLDALRGLGLKKQPLKIRTYICHD